MNIRNKCAIERSNMLYLVVIVQKYLGTYANDSPTYPGVTYIKTKIVWLLLLLFEDSNLACCYFCPVFQSLRNVYCPPPSGGVCDGEITCKTETQTLGLDLVTCWGAGLPGDKEPGQKSMDSLSPLRLYLVLWHSDYFCDRHLRGILMPRCPGQTLLATEI